jgi:hypothetical protein|tara:strand:+ start:120 stop:275 length:156 start_codon:yes stop_codon:yes gene_type:complete
MKGLFMSNGKGDRRRKQDLEKYGRNYAEIFKKFDFVKGVESLRKKEKKDKK